MADIIDINENQPHEVAELIGIAFSIGYIKSERDFQICLQLGTLALAIGYQF